MNPKETFKFEQLQRDNERLTEQNKRLEDSHQRSNELLQQNIRLEQCTGNFDKDLRHAHAALKLYDAACGVMSKARDEASNVSRS